MENRKLKTISLTLIMSQICALLQFPVFAEELVFEDFSEYETGTSLDGQNGWISGGSAKNGSFVKGYDEYNDISYAEYYFGDSGNSSWITKSFDAVSDTVIFDFDLRMKSGQGTAALQKSGEVSNHWQYTYGIAFDASAKTISAVSESGIETLTTNCYTNKWYHITMEVDTRTKKANTYTYDGNKQLGYVKGISIYDTSAEDIGNVLVTLERNLSSKCDIANISIVSDASKTVDDEYYAYPVDDNGSAPVALVYSEDFSDFEDGVDVAWSSSGSGQESYMAKSSEDDISYATAFFGISGNSKAYWTNVSVSTTAIAEFKIRCNTGKNEIFFSSDTSNLHNKGNMIAGAKTGGDKLYLKTAEGDIEVGSNDGWYTFKYTIDTVSKLYNAEVINPEGEQVIQLNAQNYITDTAGAINSLAMGLDRDTKSKADITGISVAENPGRRILPGFYSDVDDTTTDYRSDIEYMFENGYLADFDGNEFKPADKITGGELASILTRVLCEPKGYPYSEDGYEQTLKDFGIINDSFSGGAEIGVDAAEMIWNAYAFKTNAQKSGSAADACIDSGLIPAGLADSIRRDEACFILNNLRRSIEKSNTTNALATNITALDEAPDHRLSLWYNQPAWTDNPANVDFYQFQRNSLPIGNGYMGATLYGAPQLERVQFNDHEGKYRCRQRHGI